jgi:hypothetical protein
MRTTRLYPSSRGIVKYPISGRNLAHSPRSKGERAMVAVDLLNGERTLVQPTLVQVAELCRVSIPSIRAAAEAAKDPDKRRAVEQGSLPLYKVGNGKHETLAAHLRRASPGERLLAAHELGAETIFDEMVSPLL